MRSPHNYVVFLTTTVLIALTSRPSLAFKITPTQPGDSDGTYKYEEFYENSQGVTRLDAWPDLSPGKPFPPDPRRLNTGQVLEIKPGGTDGLLNLLYARFGQFWEFIPKGNLEGSFNVENYYACGSDFSCELDGARRFNSVGAAFKLNYHPEGADPTGNTVHWIQRVMVNYDVDENGQLINDQVPIDKLDIRNNAASPYFDESYQGSNPTLFRDLSSVQNPYNRTNHYFYAETYLVNEVPAVTLDPKTGVVKRRVEIYSGVRWGWENTFTPKLPQPSKTFSGTLTSGSQTDQYKLDGLTPGNYFYAWTNNSIPSNRCNPNTYLSATSGTGYNYDNDSSPTGDGFASALSGIVPNNGIIDLFVGTHSGRRGEDRGSYELNVKVYDSEPAPPSIIIGSSGGGGVTRPRPGNTQQNPILPTSNSGGWQIFNNVPSCRWYDPYTTYGFEFQALEDTLFTEILDFPVGLDNRFKVSVGNTYLGEFSPGDRVDFVSLFGQGVSHFKITDIDALIGETVETAFPIQLAFNKPVGSFQMRPFHEDETPTPQRVPEPMSVLGLLALGIWGGFQAIKINSDTSE